MNSPTPQISLLSDTLSLLRPFIYIYPLTPHSPLTPFGSRPLHKHTSLPCAPLLVTFLRFSLPMGSTLLPDLGAEILIPACAVIGIAFSLVQWLLVSKVKLSPAAESRSSGNKNGYTDFLIDEEESVNEHSVVLKCAEIQSAISEGELLSLSCLINLPDLYLDV